MHRIRRLPVLFALSVAVPVIGAAQGAGTKPPRARPFAAISESAQRLKDSVSARIRASDGEALVLPPTSSFIEPATQELILRDSVIAVARTQLGARYRLGAELPGKAFDCSGLVRFVMGMLRLDLPRTAHEQAKLGVEVPRDVASLKPGDLLTFGTSKRISHIGIYAGDGRVIHASTSKRQVIETDMERLGPKLLRNWRSARRLIAMPDSAALSDPVPTLEME